MKSFEPIVTENIAFFKMSMVAGSPIIEIISCLVFAKLSNCASKFILPIFCNFINANALETNKYESIELKIKDEVKYTYKNLPSVI